MRTTRSPADPSQKLYIEASSACTTAPISVLVRRIFAPTKYEIDRLPENRKATTKNPSAIKLHDLPHPSSCQRCAREEQPRVFAALSDREVLLQARILRIDLGREAHSRALAMGSYPLPQLMMSCCSSRRKNLVRSPRTVDAFWTPACTGPILHAGWRFCSQYAQNVLDGGPQQQRYRRLALRVTAGGYPRAPG